MNCVRCNAENPASGKFCRSCGAALGALCTRCGAVSHPDDRYCTSCGLDLAEHQSEESLAWSCSPRSGAQVPIANQYTPQEIEELLALRKTIKREETGTKTLKQDDVDKLFG